MPTRTTYVKPKKKLRYHGVDIYHAYKDDDADHQLFYWYTTDVEESQRCMFDVRDLANKMSDMKLDPEDENDHLAIIKTAIRRNLLKFADSTPEDS